MGAVPEPGVARRIAVTAPSAGVVVVMRRRKVRAPVARPDAVGGRVPRRRVEEAAGREACDAGAVPSQSPFWPVKGGGMACAGCTWEGSALSVERGL